MIRAVATLLICIAQTAHADCDTDLAFAEAINSSAPTPIIAACAAEGGDWNTVNDEGEPFILDALALYQNQDVARALIAHGADPQAEGAYGLFALQWAAGTTIGLPIVEFLLEQGANPRHVNSRGHSALLATVQGSCNAAAGNILLDQGARLSDIPQSVRDMAAQFAPFYCNRTAEEQAFVARLLATQ